MKQFIVPQFIDVENKILGPLSVRQFLILLATGGVIFVWYELFSFFIFALLGVLTLAVGGTFAFVKINSQPFHIFALTMIQTLRRPNVKVWRHGAYEKPRPPRRDKKAEAEKIRFRPKEEVTSSRLSELSLMVDTGGAYEAQKVKKEEAARINNNKQK